MKSDEVFLRHILDEADFLLERTQGLTVDAFVTDAVLTRACARSVEIIGEAVKKLSTEYRTTHRQIDWQKIAGMRDRLIHAYFERRPCHPVGRDPKSNP